MSVGSKFLDEQLGNQVVRLSQMVVNNDEKPQEFTINQTMPQNNTAHAEIDLYVEEMASKLKAMHEGPPK